MKRIIEKIRAAKTWQKRAEIARDESPGTHFDVAFQQAVQATQFEKWGAHGNAREIHQWFGVWLAETIRKGETQVLHDMADALAVWKRHKPKRDYDLEALFTMSGIFPPGWTRRWVAGFDPKTKRPIFGVKPGTRDKIAMRDIKRNLARIDPDFSEENWESRRRKIQRYAKKFKIPLDEAAGRPPRNSRHDSRKKLR